VKIYFIEVVPDWRPGRGRWWRPDGCGYTDRLERAGLYAEDHADVPIVRDSEKYRLVEAAEYLGEKLQAINAKLAEIQAMQEATDGTA